MGKYYTTIIRRTIQITSVPVEAESLHEAAENALKEVIGDSTSLSWETHRETLETLNTEEIED